MELRRDDVVSREHRGERHAVFCLADHRRLVLRLRVIAVEEVEVAVVRDALEDWVLGALVDAVPAHVGDLLSTRQLLHAAGDDAEALVLAALFAHGQQRLLAHADAEEWPARPDARSYGLDHAVLAELAHRIGNSTL